MLYDVLVVGGGPAGITAAIYAKRANKTVVVLEKFAVGGQVNLIGKIENYLGFAGVEGSELALTFSKHTKELNIPVLHEEVKEYQLDGNVKKVVTRKNVYEAKAVVLALGSHTIPLGIANEEKFTGRGVSYCAVCDGNFFKGKVVAVIGSGTEAVSDAEYLSGICKKVYLLSDKSVKSLQGDNKVTDLTYIEDNKEKTVAIDGVFVAIGRKPDTQSLRGKLKLNAQGYIKSDSKMHTSQDGVFVCGDVREGSLKQISTAVGEGAIAGTEAVKYISLQNAKKLVK